MKIAFNPLPAPGHLNPTITLAKKLVSRGHEVVIVGHLDIEPFIEATGLPFIPCCEDVYPAGSIPKIIRDLSQMSPRDASDYAIRSLGIQTESMFKSMPKVFEREGIEAVVLDSYEVFGEILPLTMGMPYAQVACAAHFDFSGGTPLCLFDSPFSTTPDAVDRNRKSAARIVKQYAEAHKGVWEQGTKLGIDWENPAATFSNLAFVTQMPLEFDFTEVKLCDSFRYAGPLHDGKRRTEIDFPWDKLTGEPIVYASLGTVANGNIEVFRMIIDAVKRQKTFQLILSIGNTIAIEELGTVPQNAIVLRNVPQMEVLQKASLCVTHAGLNTVLESLAKGVPQVAIPITHDQPGVGARVTAKRTGTIVPLAELSVDRLSAAICEVMENPIYRSNARDFEKLIEQRNGVEMAADILEEAFVT
jgi:zeaxanthin glucosyltransferase